MAILRLFLFLALASVAQAQTVQNYFVRTGCLQNGDGSANSCAGSAGGAGAFNSCVNAELGARPTTSLQVDDLQVNIYFAQDGTTASPDIGRCIFDETNWGEGDNARYLHLRPAQGQEHTGYWDNSIYHFQDAQYHDLIEVLVDYTRIEGLQFNQTRSGSSGRTNVIGYVGCDNCQIINNLTWNSNTEDTDHSCIGYNSSGVESSGVKIVNNICIGGDVCFEARPSGSGDFVVYNNTCVGALSRSLLVRRYDSSFVGTLYVKNNILAGGGSLSDYDIAGSNGSVVTSSNFTTDTTSPDGASYQSKTFTFEDATSNDYRLSSLDSSGAIDGAEDLSADIAYPLLVDILGNTRAAPWNAGAHDGDATSGGQGGGSSNLLTIIHALENY